MITSAIADFRDALPQGGRLLGLDVGTKTIGTALCDAGWTIELTSARTGDGVEEAFQTLAARILG